MTTDGTRADERLLLSVVVPMHDAYDAAHRYRSLIERLETDEVEFVLVDDGSTDGTADRFEAWLATSRPSVRVTVLRQHTKGPGGARNTGLRSARGRFVWFSDADDEWLPDALPVLRNAPADVDEVWFRHRHGDPPAAEHLFAEGVHACTGDARLAVLKAYGWLNARAFRRSWLLRHRIEYPEYTFFEDNPMEYVLPFLTNTFLVSNVVGARFWMRPNSITRFDRRPNARHFDRLLTAVLGLDAGLALAETDGERALLERKFAEQWWATRLNRGPGLVGDVAMMLRTMRQYRSEHAVHGLVAVPSAPPDWRRSRLLRRLRHVLWPLAAALPPQQPFFCDLRRGAWPHPIAWSLARAPRVGSIADCVSASGATPDARA